MKFPLTKLIYFIFAFLTISSCSLFDKDDETKEDGPEVGYFPERISYFNPNNTTVNHSFDFIYDDANKLHAIDQSDATGFEGYNIHFTYNNLGQIIKALQRSYGDSEGVSDRVINFTYQNNKLISYEEILPDGRVFNYLVDFDESTGNMKLTPVDNPDKPIFFKFDEDMDVLKNAYYNEIKYASGKGAFYYLNRNVIFQFLFVNQIHYYLFASKQIIQLKSNWSGIEIITNGVNKTDSNGMVTEIELRSAQTNELTGKYTVKYQQRVLNP